MKIFFEIFGFLSLANSFCNWIPGNSIFDCLITYFAKSFISSFEINFFEFEKINGIINLRVGAVSI